MTSKYAEVLAPMRAEKKSSSRLFNSESPSDRGEVRLENCRYSSMGRHPHSMDVNGLKSS